MWEPSGLYHDCKHDVEMAEGFHLDRGKWDDELDHVNLGELMDYPIKRSRSYGRVDIG
jgi:hypothetical protein